jgi:uncharacterized protein YdeI (YjbR/CyaY-like superfamily)
MSTQSIAVETMVVTELQHLFAAESALEQMYSSLTNSPATAGVFLHRLTDLEARAIRLERLLDALDQEQGVPVSPAVC